MPAPADHASYVSAHIDQQRKTREPDRAIAELSRRGHGVFDHTALMTAGLGEGAVQYRLRRGRIHVVHRGVYSVMHPALLSPRGRWMAAVLAGGPDAVLSHRSAAALWGLVDPGTGPVDVTAPRQHRPRKGIRFHESRLPPDEIEKRDGIPVNERPANAPRPCHPPHPAPFGTSPE